MKLLFISPPILSGTGGEVIRKRNYNLFKDYFKDDFKYFMMPYYALYPNEDKTINDSIITNLNKTLSEFKPDILYLDNSLIWLPRELFDKYKVIVFYHNIETNYLLGELKTKYVDPVLCKYVYENEEYLSKHADIRICINERDSKELKRLFDVEADYILPISFEDKANNLVNNKNGDYLLFVGSDFFGNTDGLFWFIENCLDKIDSKLLVVGKGMEKYSNKYPNKKVQFLPCVNDLSYFYKNASAVVLPIISGSGMKTKTCEAFMYGKKTFGSKEAYEGYIDYKEAGAELCNSEKDFIDKINSYIKEDNSSYIEAARNYFCDHYENKIIKEKFYSFLNNRINNYLLSVVIPVYNGENYIEQCLKPLIKMGDDVQIIICNDGSNDNSLNILKEYASKYVNIILIDKDNGGQSSARNECLKYVSGKYVTFVDIDDYLETRAIEYLRDIDKKYNVDFIQFGVVSDFKKGSFVKEKLYPNSLLLNKEQYHELFCFIIGLRDGRDLSNKYFGLVSCKFYKKEVLNGLSFVSNIVGEDTLFAEKAGLRVQSAYFLSEYLYHYKVNDGTYSHSIMKDIIPKSVRMLDEMANDLNIVNTIDTMLKDSFYNHVYDKYKWCLSAMGYYIVNEKNYRIAVLKELFSNKIYKDMLCNINKKYLSEYEINILSKLKEGKYSDICNNIYYYD